MLTARRKQDLPDLADALARGMQLVKYQGVLYIPVDFTTMEPDTALVPERRVWKIITPEQVIRIANQTQDVLFTNEAEARSYVGMVRQIATEEQAELDRILIRTDGLHELHGDGKLHELTPAFCPHYITTPLNVDTELKAQVFHQFSEWLGGDEDATSLLHHFATTLAPSWPAVRYVLLIGEGRNGKSLIMKMLVDLFGQHNVSSVTRQQMSKKDQECHDLTNKLLNVVFDGEATYLKDSGLEKTLTAGDTAQIRRLYESYPSPVQTNGLFVEGLNREPKSSDKSSALQKRIIRYYLPNVYELDHTFESQMRSPEVLGAFLSLLIDHYVKADEVAVKLAPVRTAIEMKLEHARVNNLAIQFLEYVEHTDPLGADGLIHEDMLEVAQMFKTWRLRECDDITSWATPDVETLLRPLFNSTRKSKRIKGKIMKVRTITGFTAEATEFLDYVRGEEENLDDDTLVDERAVLEDGATASS